MTPCESEGQDSPSHSARETSSLSLGWGRRCSMSRRSTGREDATYWLRVLDATASSKGTQTGSDLLWRKGSLTEICLFHGLQGPGESPKLKLCELNDFFRDFSFPSSTAHAQLFYHSAFWVWWEEKIWSDRKWAKNFLQCSWKTVRGQWRLVTYLLLKIFSEKLPPTAWN